MTARVNGFAPGDVVRIVGDVTMAGHDFRGRHARVDEVTTYKPGVIAGDTILDCRIIAGTYADGATAYGMRVYLALSDVRTPTVNVHGKS